MVSDGTLLVALSNIQEIQAYSPGRNYFFRFDEDTPNAVPLESRTSMTVTIDGYLVISTLPYESVNE